MNPRALWAAAFSAAALVTAADATAQQAFVLEGYYGCERATNGRTYCRRRGVRDYVPVAEEFFQRFKAVQSGASIGPTVINQEVNIKPQVNTTVNVVVQNLGVEYADLDGQMVILSALIDEQREIKRLGREPMAAIDKTIEAIEQRISELRKVRTEKYQEASRYQTSIRPNDFDQYISARKLSEIYPKVPYYIPGTREVGEFWVEPTVREDGLLVFKFRFIDPASRNDRTRAVIEMRPDELERTQKSLLKLLNWSITAHEKKIRKRFDKRLDCFPSESCPLEGEKVDGKASTEIVFSVNEDGSTGGRFQRNKGRFEEVYGFSVESGLMLQAYLRHVLKEGRREYEAGSQTKEDLDKIFN
ncbi:hypothetical protein [Methylorubrum aminovorans]